MKKLLFVGIIVAILFAAIFLASCAPTGAGSDGNPNGTVESVPAELPARAFSVEFKSEPGEILAGQPVSLILTVKDRSDAVVTDLPLVHEKPMHLLVVSRDLAEFYHIHPERRPDGSYRVTNTFPYGGDYKLYVDFTPKDSPQVVEQIDIKVSGTERPREALVPDSNFEKTVDGLRVRMKPSTEIQAGETLTLDFEAFDAASGKPAADLQKYLGETAHFVIISEDMKDFVHAHPMAKGESMDDMKMDSMSINDHPGGAHIHSEPEPGSASILSPEVSAHTTFPRSGLYKLWAQFQRGGKVITVPFVVNVPPGDAQKIKSVSEVNFPADAKRVIVSKDGFEPSSIKIGKGEPVKLAFYRTDTENCANEIVFVDKGITRKLPVGEMTVVEIDSANTKEISFTCGMGMMKGKVFIQ